MISDNQTSFVGQVIKSLAELFVIKKIQTTPYNPKANIVERSHRTLNAFFRAYTEKNRDTWDELLKYATFAYNNTIHSTTGYTPHELAHGFKLKIPNQLQKTKITYNYDSFADMTRNNIARALELAKEHLYTRKIQNKMYYDNRINDIDLRINEKVLVKNMTKKHKFDELYEGPYVITDLHDSYVEILKKGKKVKLHKNLIKKVKSNDTSNDTSNDNEIKIIQVVYDIKLSK